MIVDANIILDDDILNIKKKQSVLVIGQVQSGKTKFMIEKTLDALLKYEYDCTILIGGTNNLLLSQTDSRFINELKNEKINFIEIKGSIYTDMPNGKVVISTLKHQDSLEKIIYLLKYSWDNKKILIIDDESDYGGIIQGNDKSSVIYNLIYDLVNKMKNGIHLSITATPFADILSESFEFSSVCVLNANDDYMGIKYFLEHKESLFIPSNVDIGKREINSVSDSRFWSKIIIDHIKRVYESNSNVSQFLINTSLKNVVHEKVEEEIKKFFNFLSSAPLEKFFGFKDEPNKLQKYSKIIKIMSKNICSLNKFNSKWNKNEHSIIIGGASVSRGYTFEQLITTVMFNEPTDKLTADTLLQRCRWFGYRKEIIKYMKIYCSEKVIKALEECKLLIDLINENKHSIDDIRKEIKEIKLHYIEPTGKVRTGTHGSKN